MPDFDRRDARSTLPWWRLILKQREDLFPNPHLPYFQRALRNVAAARCLLVLGVLGIEFYSVAYMRNAIQEFWYLGVGYAIFSAAWLFAAYRLPKWRVAQAGVGLALDWIVSITLYGIATGGVTGGSVAAGNALILVWPVLQAGVLGSGYLAVLVALAQACFLSVQAMLHATGWLSGEATPVPYAVLVSVGLVAMGWFSQQLASRLNAQENERSLAEQRARRLEAVNRLSLAELDDGVFVADLNGRVETANPAAMRMLGLSDRALPTPLLARADLMPLAEAFDYAVRHGTEIEQQVTWKRRGVEHAAIVQCRVTKAEGRDAVVVFMRDAVRIAQQVHEAKLAAMGRLVAGIAHDIRNPLSAISQAAQLLREQDDGNSSASAASSARLANMILTHADRINDTIEDVLVLGRKPRDMAALVEIGVWLEDWADEQRSIGRAKPLKLDLSAAQVNTKPSLFEPVGKILKTNEPARIRFHADHLRRIINNLYDNALRYCSGSPDSITISLKSVAEGGAAIEVTVTNDGPVIEEPLRSQLFEPFRSGESRGTGLGLYICRELCQQNGATLHYRLLPERPTQGEFVIRAPVAAATGMSNVKM